MSKWKPTPPSNFEKIRRKWKVPARMGCRVQFIDASGNVREGRAKAATKDGILLVHPDYAGKRSKTRLELHPLHDVEYIQEKNT